MSKHKHGRQAASHARTARKKQKKKQALQERRG